MIVSELLRQKDNSLFCIPPDESLFNCIKILNDKHLGAVIVLNFEDEVLGIVSERDVLRKTYETHGKLEGIAVNEVMTPREIMIVGAPDDDIEIVMRKMTANAIRHLPILEGDQLKGMVTIGDVARFLLDHAIEEIKLLKTSRA